MLGEDYVNPLLIGWISTYILYVDNLGIGGTLRFPPLVR